MTTITINKADADGQSAYVASQVSDLQSKLSTLTTAVNLTANGALISKMTDANTSATELFARLNGADDMLKDAGATPSGGSCQKHKYND